MTIHDFRQLQELELEIPWPNSPDQVLLSSITSLELQKIIFRKEYLHRGMWPSIDRQLCELADRLRAAGYCHTLEVEVRLMVARRDLAEYDCTRFLPGFGEKGVVTVIDTVLGNRVLYSSTRD